MCPLPGLFTDLPGLVSTRVDYHADADEYDLTAMVPTGPIYESQFDVPFLGTLNNLIDAHLTFHEYLRMGDWHPQSLQGHMQATLLDYDLFEHDWEMSLPEGADLSYRCDAFEIQYATYGQSLFSDEWAWEVFDTTLWQGFVGPVPVRVVGSLDVGLGVDVNADVVIVVRDTEPVVTLDVWINPAITGWAAGEIRVEILFGLASASVRLRPSITIELPIHGYLDDTLNLQVSVDDCYRLRLDVRVRACAIFCYTSPWIEIFNCNFSCPGEEDGCALGLNSRAGQPPPDDELPSDLKYPSIAIAPDGSKTMVVYIKDSDVDPGVYRPDPHFALDTGTGYSAPASIQPADQYSQRDTSVVFLSNASALAVWTQGRLTHAEEEALPLTPEGANTGFKNSDIFYSQWSTVAGWAAPQALLEDTTPNPLIPDGRPAVAAGPGANSAWVAWVRSDNEDMLVTTGPQAGEVILSGMSIYARRIVDGLPSGPAIKLSNDDVVPNQYADIQPTVAVSPAGNTVLVVWVRDLDSDFNTSTDRLLMYAVWFAGMWYAPAPVTDPAELPGVLMPSIALSSDFDGMLTFTVRETNPAGTPAGEGNKDIVYAMQIIGASFQPAVPLTHGPTATQRPVYGRDPVARYLDSAHAAIVFRSFDGFGRDGGDGELAVASIDLSQPTPVWAFARDLTNDNYRDWDIAAAVDPAGQIRTIRDSAGGDPAFDSLLAQDIPTGPDVDIQSLEFDSPHIPAGSLVSLTVRVANAGLRTAGPTPPPNTILRVGRLVGDVFQEIAATPFTFDAAPGTALAFRYEDLDYASSEPQTWRAIVEPISGEYDTTNNVADVVLGVLPPVNMACVPVFDGGPSKVGLTWANAESYQEILIDRNGRLIARLAGDAESYVDNRVAPGTHEWSVRGRIASGVSAAAAATCTSEVPRRGDLNCSGEVGFGDINPFVLILSNPAAWQAAYPGCPLLNGDINGDGSVNFADINPFVALLSGG